MRTDPECRQLHHRLKAAGRLKHRHEQHEVPAREYAEAGHIEPDADCDGQGQSQHAIGADAAVMHDADFGFGIASAAEAVGHIGQAVLMHGARQEDHRGKAKDGDGK